VTALRLLVDLWTYGIVNRFKFSTKKWQVSEPSRVTPTVRLGDVLLCRRRGVNVADKGAKATLQAMM
jgi:hypothetical protein